MRSGTEGERDKGRGVRVKVYRFEVMSLKRRVVIRC